MICLIQQPRYPRYHPRGKTRRQALPFLLLPAGDWSQCFVSTTVIKVLTWTTPTPPGNYYHITVYFASCPNPKVLVWQAAWRQNGLCRSFRPTTPPPLNLAWMSTMQRPGVLWLERERGGRGSRNAKSRGTKRTGQSHNRNGQGILYRDRLRMPGNQAVKEVDWPTQMKVRRAQSSPMSSWGEGPV